MESIQSILQPAETMHENHPEDRVNNLSRHSEFLWVLFYDKYLCKIILITALRRFSLEEDPIERTNPMKTSEVERNVRKWIKEVSKVRKELGNFSICPFAAKARYLIVECAASAIVPVEGYQVIIYVIEESFDLPEVQRWVKIYNEKYKEWKFFEDCASYDTYIKDIKTNNGLYNLILAQPKEELREFRKKLAKTDYYDNWDEEYLREILQDDYDLIQKG